MLANVHLQSHTFTIKYLTSISIGARLLRLLHYDKPLTALWIFPGTVSAFLGNGGSFLGVKMLPGIILGFLRVFDLFLGIPGFVPGSIFAPRKGATVPGKA